MATHIRLIDRIGIPRRSPSAITTNRLSRNVLIQAVAIRLGVLGSGNAQR